MRGSKSQTVVLCNKLSGEGKASLRTQARLLSVLPRHVKTACIFQKVSKVSFILISAKYNEVSFFFLARLAISSNDRGVD
jgi:hypothetical protein